QPLVHQGVELGLADLRPRIRDGPPARSFLALRLQFVLVSAELPRAPRIKCFSSLNIAVSSRGMPGTVNDRRRGDVARGQWLAAFGCCGPAARHGPRSGLLTCGSPRLGPPCPT